MTGDRHGRSNKRGIGWECVHVAVDERSRHGIAVERVMTDNGSAYKSFAYRELLAEHRIRHKRTRPYTPCTNGKAEGFIKASLREWA